MTGFRSLLLSCAVLLVLGGCGRRASQDDLASAYCPEALKVQDAQRLTRFKPGPGRDPRDVMFDAVLTQAATICSMSRDRMAIELKLIVAVNAGPSVGAGTSSVPYFVRLVDSNGVVRDGRDFNADFKLSTSNPRGQSVEELTLTVPFARTSDLNAYRVAVGLKPTPEELQYNRRAEGR